MAVKYLAGNRLQGTAAERAALTAFATASSANTGWKLLGSSSTLANSNDSIIVDSITAKDNMMVLGWAKDNGSGSTYHTYHFNDDVSSGAYRWQYANDGGSASRQGDTWILTGREINGAVSNAFSVMNFKNL